VALQPTSATASRLGVGRLVVGLADPTGAVPTIYTYEPFGKTTVSGSATSSFFGFTGRDNDSTGTLALYNYRARYYSSTFGRFLTRDPIESLTQAPYSYAGNDPLNNDDPSGLNRCEIGANPLRWVGNGVACIGKVAKYIRAPDYISADIPIVFPLVGPTGIGPDVNITVNRDGKLYVGPGVSAGLAGFAPSIRAGWLDQLSAPSNARVDKFTSRWSVTAGGTLPMFGGFGPSVGETYGFGGFATEVGVGFGAGAGVTGNYSWKLSWEVPGW
jgi:RHS repeat-associated protein